MSPLTSTSPFETETQAFLANCEIQPRRYQERIIRQTLQHFFGTPGRGEEGPPSPPRASSVLIESPTGSGKTVMGLAVAAMIQQRTGARVGWVAMRRNLLTQAADENARRRFGGEIQWISMFDKDPPDVDLLIIDEAQHDAATSMANLHGKVRPRWTLGLSATPYRTDRIKLCFEQVIRDAGIAHLIADGHLSPYHHYTIDEHTPACIAERLIEEPERWGKSLVFFHNEMDCRDLQARLSAADVRSDVVTAKTNRVQQLADFRNGKTDVLINMAILTEGFDCPDLQSVFCRPSGKGPTIQMAGRVLRKSDVVPTKNVIQCRRTRHPMMRTAMPAEQSLWTCGQWRTIAGNRRIDEMAAAARQQVARAKVRLPQLIAMHRSARGVDWLQRSAS